MARKPDNGISYQALHKPVYTATEHGLMLEMFHSETSKMDCSSYEVKTKGPD